MVVSMNGRASDALVLTIRLSSREYFLGMRHTTLSVSERVNHMHRACKSKCFMGLSNQNSRDFRPACIRERDSVGRCPFGDVGSIGCATILLFMVWLLDMTCRQRSKLKTRLQRLGRQEFLTRSSSKCWEKPVLPHAWSCRKFRNICANALCARSSGDHWSRVLLIGMEQAIA